MVGSLYVYEIDLQLYFNASFTTSEGLRYVEVFIFFSWLIPWFWQKEHLKLQPTVPNDNDLDFGRKWYRGFFSIGSIFIADIYP